MKNKSLILILLLLILSLVACGTGQPASSNDPNNDVYTDPTDTGTDEKPDIIPSTFSEITTPLISSIPAAGENGVSKAAAIELKFVDDVALEKISEENIKVVSDGVAVTGEFITNNSSLKFAPSEPFKYGSLVVVNIANLSDKDGKKINKLVSFSFKVEAEPDLSAPAFLESTPANNALDVATNGQITLKFGEAIDPEKCDVRPVLSYLNNEVSGLTSLSDANKTLTFKPLSELGYEMLHEFKVSVCDKAGNETFVAINFTTAVAPDTTPPSKATLSYINDTRATLSWLAPGDDGNIGKANKYVMKKSIHPIETEDDFDNATPIKEIQSPAEAGVEEFFVVPEMGINEKWYIALRSYDEANNASEFASIELNTATDSTFLVETFADAVRDDYFGYKVTANCDINADGYTDVVVGEAYDDVAGVNTGRVHVYFGGKDTMGVAGDVGRTADLIINGIDSHITSADDFFGYSVSCNHDFNGDGYDDILIGAPYEDTKNGVIYSGNSGAAYLFYGKEFSEAQVSASDYDVIFQGLIAGDLFGWSAAGIGDINNDGFDDIAIAASAATVIDSKEGVVYVFYGSDLAHGTNVLDINANSKIVGKTVGASSFGLSGIVKSGDIDGDNILDIAITAATYPLTAKGTVYIFLGKNGLPSYIDLSTVEADITLTGVDDNDYFGGYYGYTPAVTMKGDVNNDGIADLIVGAYQDDIILSNNGAVYIYYGREVWAATLSPVDADVIISGKASSDYFGVSVDSDGDYNNDGINDILIGARQHAFGGNYGAAFIFYGHEELSSTLENVDADVIVTSSKAAIKDIGLNNINASDYLGNDVFFAGDVNGDGYEDIIMGAYGNETGGRPTNAGAAYLVY